MSKQKLVIATRNSPLAVWQAEHIQQRLEALHPGLKVELLGMKTKGDQLLHSPLSKIGGKGLFVKELENALYDQRADIAVHSMKDVPMELPEGMVLPVICEREEPWDAFVCNDYNSIDELPEGAVVGSSSLRRQTQIRSYRPDLEVKWLRGNIQSRMGKLDDGQYDAIILASSGLVRMGYHERIAQRLPPEICLPAVGQGALGIECREDDADTQALIAPLAHQVSTWRVLAERGMNRRLEGGCQVPIAGFATLDDDTLTLKGLVGEPDGSHIVHNQQQVTFTAGQEVDQAIALGQAVGDNLLGQGADKILEALKLESPDGGQA